MPCPFYKIIFAVVWCTLFFGGFLLFYSSKSRRNFMILRELATHYNGQVVRQALIFPKLIFPWQNYRISAFITLPAKTNPTLVIVSAVVDPIKRFDFFIERKGLWPSIINRPFGSRAIVTNSAVFDQEFLIFTKDGVEIAHILTPKVQEALFTIKEQNPSICFQNHQLTIKASYSAHDAQEVRRLVDAEIALLCQLKASTLIQ